MQSSAILLNHSTYPYPVKTILSMDCIEVFTFFPLILFSLPHIQVSCRWSLFRSSFCLFIYGRASLAIEGKSVVPMEITFMDMEDKYKKYGTFRSLRYIYSNPFRFPISSLGLPNIPSQEGWEGALAKCTANARTLTRQIPESYNHFFLLSILYYQSDLLFSTSCF